MDASTVRPSRKHLSTGIITVIVACSFLAMTFVWPMAQALARAADRQARHTELAQARARWQSQAFPSYRLSIQLEPSDRLACEMVFEVRVANQIKLVRDNCGMPNDSNRLAFIATHGTIPDLFDYIAGEIDKWGGCGPNGCACDGRRIVDVVYEHDRGYPQRFTERYQQDWTTQRILHGCSLMGFSEPSPFTVAVNPIE